MSEEKEAPSKSMEEETRAPEEDAEEEKTLHMAVEALKASVTSDLKLPKQALEVRFTHLPNKLLSLIEQLVLR